MAVFTMRNRNEGLFLLDFLSAKLKISRNRAKNILNARNVFVNRQRVWMARHQLNPGDVVEAGYHFPVHEMDSILDLLFENKDFLIVNKPAGILSNGPNSIESRLRKQLNLQSLTAVHRLDKDTTGCLLMAKNINAAEKAFSLFRNRIVKKRYDVIVRGQVQWKKRVVAIPIEKQRAVTRLITLDSNKDASHLSASIETGRTHQVRKHLSAVRHPLLGDCHYGTRFGETDKTIAVPRQMLHASEIRFYDPAERCAVRAFAPLPSDFRDCLKSFGLR